MSWFRLADRLGMSVARAQAEIDSAEFSDWCAYLRMEDDPDDIRTARLCTVIAQCAGAKNVKPEGFMPKRARKAKAKSGDELKRAFVAYAKAHNRRLARKEAHDRKVADKRAAREAKAARKRGE